MDEPVGNISNLTNSSPTQGQYIPYSVAFLSINMALVPLICLGNLLVIIVICRNRNLQNSTNYFLFSLALSDLLVGAGAPYFSVVHYTSMRIDLHKIPCLVGFCIMILTCGLSQANLVGISVDRYICIQHPYQYIRLVTPRRVKVIISCIWIYGMAIAFLPLAWNTWISDINCGFALVLPTGYLIILVIHVFLFLIITAILYTKILVTAKKVQNQIQMQEQRFTRGIFNLRKQTKAAQVYVILLGCFYLCWLPFLISTGVRMAYKKQEPLKLRIIFQIFISLAFSNSCMNFLIYTYKIHDFKVAFRKLFGCLHPQVDIDPNTIPRDTAKTNTKYHSHGSIYDMKSINGHNQPENSDNSDQPKGSIILSAVTLKRQKSQNSRPGSSVLRPSINSCEEFETVHSPIPGVVLTSHDPQSPVSLELNHKAELVDNKPSTDNMSGSDHSVENADIN